MFHEFVLCFRNYTCPQCRQNCPKNTVHRVYLPESTFEKGDILEKLNEISVQKKDQETLIKELENQKKKLEYELKLKKKQYHKVLQRNKTLGKHSKSKILEILYPSIRKDIFFFYAYFHFFAFFNFFSSFHCLHKAVNIPRAEQQPSTSTSNLPSTSAHTSNSEKNSPTTTSTSSRRIKRNASRVARSKAYFRRRRVANRNSRNNNEPLTVDNNNQIHQNINEPIIE